LRALRTGTAPVREQVTGERAAGPDAPWERSTPGAGGSPPTVPRSEDTGVQRVRRERSAGAVVRGVTGAVAVLPGVTLRWRIVRGAARLLLLLTGVRLTTEGAEKLPDRPPYVVAANHASFIDPLILALLLPEPAVFAAVGGLADNPLVRRFVRRMDAHLVERGDRVRGVATRSLERGKIVLSLQAPDRFLHDLDIERIVHMLPSRTNTAITETTQIMKSAARPSLPSTSTVNPRAPLTSKTGLRMGE
jgi:hypothetical protein